jgi:hypothetical protein
LRSPKLLIPNYCPLIFMESRIRRCKMVRCKVCKKILKIMKTQWNLSIVWQQTTIHACILVFCLSSEL